MMVKALRRSQQVVQQLIKLSSLDRIKLGDSLSVEMLHHHLALPPKLLAIREEGDHFVPTHP